MWTDQAMTNAVTTWSVTDCDTVNGVVAGYYVTRLTAVPSPPGAANVAWLSFGNPSQTSSPAAPVSSTFPGGTYAGVWTFDNVANLGADATSHANNATSNACVAAVGQVGGAIQCNGAGQLMQIPSSASLQPSAVTVTAALKAVVTPSSDLNVIVKDSRLTAPYKAWAIAVHSSGGISFDVGTGSGLVACATGIAPAVGQWYRIAGSYDGTNAIKVYVNGVLAASCSASGNISYTGNVLSMGGDGSASFNGYVDDVMVLDSVQSADWNVAWGRAPTYYAPVRLMQYSVTPGTLHDDGTATSGDTAVLTTTLAGVTYVTGNDGTGAPAGSCNSNLWLSTFTTKYTSLANQNCMTGFGTMGQQNVPSSWTDTNTWKSAGIIAVHRPANDQLWWIVHRQQPALPYLGVNAFLMRSFDGGATWCNPAHSTGVDSCSTTNANGDPPAAADTPTFSLLPQCVHLRFIQYEAGAMGAIQVDNNQSYIHGLCSDGSANHLYGIRVARGVDPTIPANWQIYTGAIGGDWTNSSNWHANSSAGTDLLGSAGNLSAHVEEADYVGPPFNYLALWPAHAYSEFSIYVLQADTPSGPWHTIGLLPGDPVYQPNYGVFDYLALTHRPAWQIPAIFTGSYTGSHYNLQYRILTLHSSGVHHGN